MVQLEIMSSNLRWFLMKRIEKYLKTQKFLDYKGFDISPWKNSVYKNSINKITSYP